MIRTLQLLEMDLNGIFTVRYDDQSSDITQINKKQYKNRFYLTTKNKKYQQWVYISNDNKITFLPEGIIRKIIDFSDGGYDSLSNIESLSTQQEVVDYLNFIDL